MSVYKKAWLLLAFISFSLLSISAQEIVNQEEDNQSHYFKIALGLGTVNIRDFGVSPLFYKGSNYSTGFGFWRKTSRIENNVDLLFNIGTPSLNYNNTTSSSFFPSLNLAYSQLGRLPWLSNENWNTKIGATMDVAANLRINPDMGNSASGFASEANFMGSIKFTRDISRKKSQVLNLWFLKKKLSTEQRELSFTIHGGILNTNYRPGYAYIAIPKIENNSYKLFDDYKFSFGDGFRMKSRLDFTCYRTSKNAFQISYIFDAYRANGKYDQPLEVAWHTIQYTILFQRRKKS